MIGPNSSGAMEASIITAQPAWQLPTSGAFNPAGPALDYVIDLSQRMVLFWDVMRQRGNGYREHLAKTVPHVSFRRCLAGAELREPEPGQSKIAVPCECVAAELALVR